MMKKKGTGYFFHMRTERCRGYREAYNKINDGAVDY